VCVGFVYLFKEEDFKITNLRHEPTGNSEIWPQESRDWIAPKLPSVTAKSFSSWQGYLQGGGYPPDRILCVRGVLLTLRFAMSIESRLSTV